ncbi:unnamed protein product [Ceratitis capitata]|uniref:(Mediterranean fruit fly) hypothetical protein n=1 Tax=Ceratitis capitata TaxID=7213 RepID=A0A811V9T3_CERCA|nr:unnamed protein product [Ceratitis capitata]
MLFYATPLFIIHTHARAHTHLYTLQMPACSACLAAISLAGNFSVIAYIVVVVPFFATFAGIFIIIYWLLLCLYQFSASFAHFVFLFFYFCSLYISLASG